MNVRSTRDLARHAIALARGARHATTAAQPNSSSQTGAGVEPEYGQQIYVYNHLQKNHVVYSLTKALKNNKAIKQLPFNGKQTVPRALRKDLWHPLATISFPSGSGEIGLSAYQKLREYRKRHELEWDDSIMKNKDGKFLPKHKRARQLCDQKANSVADMAAVLGRLAEQKFEDKIGIKGEGTGAVVNVKWNDLLDAEFAETWSDNVVHDKLESHTNHRDFNKVWGLKKHIMGEREMKQRRRRPKKEVPEIQEPLSATV
ncbi:hypothetical protein G7Y89_g175 [Cudoniella acicularis]|uniref:Large ribosomal subunit protein mL67 n=1 Tax=Cudoniella acicularis TaxID=354080 RepID=A0A8H4WBF3_9HELO|nr:hypothetical protein G7Y89_g175 [Cudoniella acicularis]